MGGCVHIYTHARVDCRTSELTRAMLLLAHLRTDLCGPLTAGRHPCNPLFMRRLRVHSSGARLPQCGLKGPRALLTSAVPWPAGAASGLSSSASIFNLQPFFYVESFH